jgi:hypothetical protein
VIPKTIYGRYFELVFSNQLRNLMAEINSDQFSAEATLPGMDTQVLSYLNNV